MPRLLIPAIVAVGCRVNSYQATQFRIWATNPLREFIVKGLERWKYWKPAWTQLNNYAKGFSPKSAIPWSAGQKSRSPQTPTGALDNQRQTIAPVFPRGRPLRLAHGPLRPDGKNRLRTAPFSGGPRFDLGCGHKVPAQSATLSVPATGQLTAADAQPR